MAKQKPYSLTYDKYVPNRHGGVDIERSVVRAPNRTVAVKIMKNDLYNHGAYGARGMVRYKNGKTERLQPRKAPVINMDETLNSKVYRERMPARWFGNFNKK